MRHIRNFAIIAHVDHGKSTLADRFLEITGVVDPTKHEEQLLDRNPISRERGITIKLAPVHMEYTKGDITYELNLIDTPGHVDFSYEVERTLACVEGVILLVDATKGVQAQTIAHTYKAIEQNLEIIPVINKIDMPQAQIEETRKQLVEFLGVEESSIRQISAKTGAGVKELLEDLIDEIPAPKES
ncbi:GTP-binding protein, partial [Candidatus Woesebacteria bacterium]|nr:GTP-binding protein [Candidatus Woesebacteria bacterium]